MLHLAITHMHDNHNVFHTYPAEITNIFVHYYEEVLISKTTMFDIDNNKSPGPDECGSGFFKATWSVIGMYITAAILEFFNNGKLPKILNSTIISLIPKVIVLAYAGKFRPISCCNVLYKYKSKMLYNSRLNKDIYHTVADNQAAFVGGKSLVYNVFTCHDLLRQYNRKISPRCLTKINLIKAYDMIS